MKCIFWDELSLQGQATACADIPQPERELIRQETTAEVSRLLQTLHPKYRLAVILKYWHGMSHEEIAETMNTTTSAIKSRLFRARKMMVNDVLATSQLAFIPRRN
jgi:RNA polymerase sigma-70 factor (ECF subfamily)